MVGILFGENFPEYLCRSLEEIANDWAVEEVYAEFRGELARTMSYESGITEDLHEIKDQAKKKESMKLT